MNRRKTAIMLFIILIGAFSLSVYLFKPRVDTGQYRSNDAKIDEFVKNAKYLLLNEYDLDKPIKTEVKMVGNINDPQYKVKSIHEIYDGLEIYYNQQLDSKDKHLNGVNIKNSKYKLKGDITIGTKREKVEHVLGKPTYIEQGVYCYQSDSLSIVNIKYKDDVVTELIWGYGAP